MKQKRLLSSGESLFCFKTGKVESGMHVIEIIQKKRDKKILSKAEIEFLVSGYTDGRIPDYQMSAFLMAVYLNGLNDEETSFLTLAMAQSGEQMDLSSISGIKVDKHSTGGVGDKTTLIVAPIVASCGVPVAKMSGRGLGHTGGTVDKLESIPGYQTDIGIDKFLDQVRKIGIALAGQTGNLTPADKKIYALRDVTGTVESIPLIAASIMSKKIAAGADAILLDVKVGSGAFMKTLEDGRLLAKTMVQIGNLMGRKTTALLTDMDIPLGKAVGNALEIIEATEIFRGKGDERLKELCLSLASHMLFLAGKGSLEYCRVLAQESIQNGSAFMKWKELVSSQGGDLSYLDHLDDFPVAHNMKKVLAPQSGYISGIDTYRCGLAACLLGAGRERKDDLIDSGAGIVFKKSYGEYAEKGEVLAVLYTEKKECFLEAEKWILESFSFSELPPPERKIIIESYEI